MIIQLTFGVGYLFGKNKPIETQIDEEIDSEDEDEIQEGLETIKPGILEPCKLVSQLTKWICFI